MSSIGMEHTKVTLSLQEVYNKIIEIINANDIYLVATPPRPYLIKRSDYEKFEAEAKKLTEKNKIDEYNKMAEEAYKDRLYFDQAWLCKNFY